MLRILFTLAFVLLCTSLNAAERPNILWLSVEDMSPHLGCYGDQHARTPNIDRLAAEGILYENAFSTAPVCAPSRSAIITGVYATSLGSHHMRSTVTLPPEIRCFPAFLRETGYFCTNNAKEDYNFRTPPGSWDQSNGKAHWRNRPDPKQPFFAVFNYTGTHESHIRGDEPAYSRAIAKLKSEELHDPETLDLPPYYPDTPKVRAEWARYYNLVTALDHWVAKHLKDLEDAGLADNTIVMFWSDHGVGMPRGKRWLYDSGIHVPLIVRVPPKYNHLLPEGKGGSRTDELVSLVDLAPTVLNLAGQPIPTYMQGRAFLGENLTPEREYVFAARDRMDERYDMSRVVRTKQYSYIRNFMPWRPYAQWLSYAEQSPTMQELRRLRGEGKLTEEQGRFLVDRKSVEELYDLHNDPHQLTNVVERDEIGDQRTEIHDELERYLLQFRDLGLLPESEQAERTKNGNAAIELFRDDLRSLTRTVAATAAANAADLLSIEVEFSVEKVNQPALLWREPFIEDSDPAVRRWALHFADLDLLPSWQTVPRAENRLNDRATLVRLAAAEIGSRDHTSEEALAVMLDSAEHALSPWDQLQAANVLDLIPDFDKHAAEISPVVERVHKKLSEKRKPSQAEGYILRVTEHLRERLENAP